jgi:hypothetical protein
MYTDTNNALLVPVAQDEPDDTNVALEETIVSSFVYYSPKTMVQEVL